MPNQAQPQHAQRAEASCSRVFQEGPHVPADSHPGKSEFGKVILLGACSQKRGLTVLSLRSRVPQTEIWMSLGYTRGI